MLAPDTYFMTQRSGYVSIKSEQEHIAVVEEFMARFEQVQQVSTTSTDYLKNPSNPKSTLLSVT